jgi:hypothetical protein
MTYLNAEVHVFNRALAFQITSQSKECEEFLSALVGNSYTTTGGWTIRIADVPELNIENKTIFLRGSETSANLRVDRNWGLDSQWDTLAIASDVRYALTEFDNSVYNFVHIPTAVGVNFIEIDKGQSLSQSEPSTSSEGNKATLPEINN